MKLVDDKCLSLCVVGKIQGRWKTNSQASYIKAVVELSVEQLELLSGGLRPKEEVESRTREILTIRSHRLSYSKD